MQILDRSEGDDRHDVSICGRRILSKSPDQRARTYVHFRYHAVVDSEKEATFRRDQRRRQRDQYSADFFGLRAEPGRPVGVARHYGNRWGHRRPHLLRASDWY